MAADDPDRTRKPRELNASEKERLTRLDRRIRRARQVISEGDDSIASYLLEPDNGDMRDE
jgi:hypothetical protein